ncbi:unnamed protein product [Owenia fusiformis]|uniref:Uncharacterized protein n=1 Tax=Owenia fusiformis TaxID=6347 RepID=A0A8J1USJ0_OWEFU|nr:unnamed protein product [Owenia fusiformis]
MMDTERTCRKTIRQIYILVALYVIVTAQSTSAKNGCLLSDNIDNVYNVILNTQPSPCESTPIGGTGGGNTRTNELEVEYAKIIQDNREISLTLIRLQNTILDIATDKTNITYVNQTLLKIENKMGLLNENVIQLQENIRKGNMENLTQELDGLRSSFKKQNKTLYRFISNVNTKLDDTTEGLILTNRQLRETNERLDNAIKYLRNGTTNIPNYSSNTTVEKCPPSSVQYEGTCYTFIKQQMTWHQAELTCLTLGGHLVAIETQSEQDFIVGYLDDNDMKGFDYWIGANDLIQEGQFIWVGTNKPLSYTTWADINGPQPDNNKGKEHCVHLRDIHDLNWNDINCFEYEFRSICEYT